MQYSDRTRRETSLICTRNFFFIYASFFLTLTSFFWSIARSFTFNSIRMLIFQRKRTDLPTISKKYVLIQLILYKNHRSSWKTIIMENPILSIHMWLYTNCDAFNCRVPVFADRKLDWFNSGNFGPSSKDLRWMNSQFFATENAQNWGRVSKVWVCRMYADVQPISLCLRPRTCNVSETFTWWVSQCCAKRALMPCRDKTIGKLWPRWSLRDIFCISTRPNCVY